MPSLLHPCKECGHKTMDECWSASQRLLLKHRKLCVECHDDCLTKEQDPPGRSFR